MKIVKISCKNTERGYYRSLLIESIEDVKKVSGSYDFHEDYFNIKLVDSNNKVVFGAKDYEKFGFGNSRIEYDKDRTKANLIFVIQVPESFDEKFVGCRFR